MRKLLAVLASIVALTAASCGLSPSPTQATPTAAALIAASPRAPTATPEAAMPTSMPSGTQPLLPPTESPAVQPTEEPAAGPAIERFHSPVMSPVLVRIGPKDEILLLDTHSLEIRQLQPDGSLSVYASFPGLSEHRQLEHFGFDPSGQLWISVNNGNIYRVNADGSPEFVAAGNRWFSFNSQGVLYAVDSPSTNVQRITAQGEVQTLAEGFGRAHNVTVAAGDRVLVVEQERGELIEVFDDGSWKKIADGLAFDHSIAAAPDGGIFLIDWSGLEEVNLATGEQTRLEWYDKYSNTGEKAVFDSAGLLYTFHPNQPIYRLDLRAQTSEMIFHPRGNTWAMAVGPGSRVFAAYGGLIPGAETTLYEITEGDVLVEAGSVPYRFATSLAFAPGGTGYLSVGGPSGAAHGTPQFWGGAIYSFDPGTGVLQEVYSDPDGHPYEMAVDPTTGYLWWIQHQSLQYRDGEGRVVAVSYPDPAGDAVPRYLTFAPDGSLWALVVLPPDGNTLWHIRLYRRDIAGTWTEMIAADGPSLGLFSQAICPDGSNYLFGYTFDASSIDPRRTGVMFLVYGVEEDGALALLARDTASDPFAADCDPLTGEVYFTNTNGIDRFASGHAIQAHP